MIAFADVKKMIRRAQAKGAQRRKAQRSLLGLSSTAGSFVEHVEDNESFSPLAIQLSK